MNSYLFSILPLWVIYLIIVFFIVLSIRGGIAFAKWRKKRHKNDDESAINTMVGATLGLLTFILAFTFSLSSSRFDARKQFFLEEVNSIETSWLRAGLMEQPYGNQIRSALVDYTEVRFLVIENQDDLKKVVAEAEKIQNQIWALIVKNGKTIPPLAEKSEHS
jgi:hypothetical protein